MNPAFTSLMEFYPALAPCGDDLQHAFELLKESFQKNGKLLICGNGGSAADCEHIVGELMKGFLSKRPITPAIRKLFEERLPNDGAFLADHLQGALPAISLASHSALISAFSNDVTEETAFAQQVYGYGRHHDVLLAISTSGNSANVLRAVQVAKVMGLSTIGLSGISGGKIAEFCDVTIKVPRKLTHEIQELHLPVYHSICRALEKEFFPEETKVNSRQNS